jgi:cytochrome c biogenesis factor
LAAVFAISIAITIATLTGYITWCNDAPLSVNMAVSFTLPIAVFSLFGAFTGLKTLELRLIHLSIPLLIIGVLISWPYAYYGNYESLTLKKGEVKSIDGLKIEFISTEFYEPVGKVFARGVNIPEESVEVIKFSVNGGVVDAKVRLNLPWLLNGREFVFVDPAIINEGLDNYYIVVPDVYAFDLFMFTSKYLYEQNRTQMLKLTAEIMGFKYDEFIEKLNTWEESDEVVILYKRVPCINLVWFACALMLVGEILGIVRWRKHA